MTTARVQHSPLAAELGARIKQIRVDRNESQVEFAQPLNVTPVAVGYWERGLALPKADKLVELVQKRVADERGGRRGPHAARRSHQG